MTVVEDTAVLTPHFCIREGGNQRVKRWHRGVPSPVPWQDGPWVGGDRRQMGLTGAGQCGGTAGF